MKKILAALIILSGIWLPIACSSKNPTTLNPVTPSGTVTGTITPGTTPSVTPSGTITPGTGPTPFNTPTYEGNCGTSAAPRGMYYDSVFTNSVIVAEAEVKVGGDVTAVEKCVPSANPSLQFKTNLVVIGSIPTPDITPAWQGTTVVLVGPQAVALAPGGTYPFATILDASPNGGATLYMGDYGADFYSAPFDFVVPSNTNGYGGSPFVSPTAMAVDSILDAYVADPGTGYVSQLAIEDTYPFIPTWLHRWNGSASGSLFKKPNTIACDSSNDVYIGDAGYNPSVVQAYSPGGTTLIGNWDLAANSVINGLAVTINGGVTYLYASDIGNSGPSGGGLVEEYQVINSTTVNLVSTWGDPHGAHEYLSFYPSCIALDGSYVLVGDTNNDLVNVFN